MTESRKTAYKILYKCEKSGSYSNIALLETLKSETMSGVDKALTTAIVYGTLSRKITLDFIISKLSAKPLDKLDLSVIIILRMSLYQLIYMDKIPASAACNEAVLLTKKVVNVGASGFVNGLLRSYLRQKDNIKLPDDLSVKYSVSKDICELLISQYSDEELAQIFEGYFFTDNMFLSVNLLKTTTKELACSLGGEMLWDGVIRLKTTNIAQLKEFEKGLFFVQDSASSTAVKLLNPKENDILIDVCAAPGGKSLKAAIMMKNRGRIYSFDIHENKLGLIEKSAARLGIDIIKTAKKDAAVFDERYAGFADKIICDVPCSGLGVIAKKPEIRYKNIKDIENLYPIQQRILQNSSRYLKKGGYLLYSTCTINKLENEEQVKVFLENNNEFTLIEDKTLLPSENGDGFYMALLLKTEE